ncbi:carbohydrate ABC transporter permease [Paenibacillaceae bacterium WGS1546]|uniref:carbohydrate ABC transporter permease n=1 Tax=Cohnella sp. WGS1546 TaxID=3366810 RepID=UPI00372D7BD9
MMRRMSAKDRVIFLLLIVLAVVFLSPLLIILMNSFKGKFYISDEPFRFPDSATYIGWDNYTSGLAKTNFADAFGMSSLITICSVGVIVCFTPMAAWYIARVKTWYTRMLYFLIVFSMIVPFQMVMYTLTKVANSLYLDNLYGIVFIYLGFGCGLSVFLYAGFVKSLPVEIEEAVMMDGANPVQLFFKVVFPILKPVAVTVAILNLMWVWNDYLLPFLVIGSEYKTIPIAIQYLKGGYGSVDMGAMMAMLVLAILPVVVFYLFCQRYIIEGVVAGAVKG